MKKKLTYVLLIIVAFLLAFQLRKIYYKNQQQVPVLAYHRIVLTEKEKENDPDALTTKDFEEFKKIFETDQYKNKYGNGLIRKICVTINRKLHIFL